MNFAQINDLQQNIAAQGGKHLGTLLWWSLGGNRIERLALESVASANGLDEAYLPAEVKPTTAFRRAWRSAGSHLPEGLMLRQIKEDENEIVVGIVNERVDKASLELDYATVSRVHFVKGTGDLVSDGTHCVFDKILELYRHHLAHTTEDVRSMLTAFVRRAGVSLRENGGTYFVPAQWQGMLNALAATVQDLGRNKVYQLPLYDAPQVRDALTNVARSSLDEEIRALQAELSSFDEKTRQSTMERRLVRFDELRSRVDVFAGVLSFKAEDLAAKLDSAHRELRVRLGLEGAPVVAQQEDRRSPEWSFEQSVGF